MPRRKVISGRRCVKILVKHFGFVIVRRRGSHIVLRKDADTRIGTVVPDHRELKVGTLKSVLRLAEVSEKEFLRLA